MWYRFVIFSIILLLLTGCAKTIDHSPVAIQIDGIHITVDEFEKAYRNSYYGKDNLPESRRSFLENLITTKLILREAERMRLDKDPSFLKDIEFFWQQSLLKLMLDVKAKELSLDLKIDDAEIRGYYDRHKDTDFKDKVLADVYGQIQWILLRTKQQDTVKDWLDSLKKKTDIHIDYGLLDAED